MQARLKVLADELGSPTATQDSTAASDSGSDSDRGRSPRPSASRDTASAAESPGATHGTDSNVRYRRAQRVLARARVTEAHAAVVQQREALERAQVAGAVAEVGGAQRGGGSITSFFRRITGKDGGDDASLVGATASTAKPSVPASGNHRSSGAAARRPRTAVVDTGKAAVRATSAAGTTARDGNEGAGRSGASDAVSVTARVRAQAHAVDVAGSRSEVGGCDVSRDGQVSTLWSAGGSDHVSLTVVPRASQLHVRVGPDTITVPCSPTSTCGDVLRLVGPRYEARYAVRPEVCRCRARPV